MDWASMVLQMYKSWAQRRGYRVTLIDEMPGEIAGIKVLFLPSQLPPFIDFSMYYCTVTYP